VTSELNVLMGPCSTSSAGPGSDELVDFGNGRPIDAFMFGYLEGSGDCMFFNTRGESGELDGHGGADMGEEVFSAVDYFLGSQLDYGNCVLLSDNVGTESAASFLVLGLDEFCIGSPYLLLSSLEIFQGMYISPIWVLLVDNGREDPDSSLQGIVKESVAMIASEETKTEAEDGTYKPWNCKCGQIHRGF